MAKETIGTSNFEKVTFDSKIGGGNKIAAFFAPSKAENVKGIIQICHGMAEHFGRYEEMVEFFNNEGYHVAGMDMLGHGATYELNKNNVMPLGYFGGDKNSWMYILDDEKTFNKLLREKFEVDDNRLPIFLYGHSMGSFVVRNLYAMRDVSEFFSGFIFSSTKGFEPLVGFGLFLSNLMTWFGQGMETGKLIDGIAFGAYNKKIPDAKTSSDWISTDEASVKKYIEDPHCAFKFTNKGFHDLFAIINRMQSKKTYQNSSEKPCMLTYGEADPVGNYGKGPVEVAKKYEANSNRKVKLVNFGPYRHEIQHEPQKKQEYFNCILEFMKECVEEK